MAEHTFRVENLKQGLERIKDELGPSAVILGTKRVVDERGRALLEIVAGIDDEQDSSSAQQAEDRAGAQSHAIGQIQKALLALTEQLQRVQSELRHLRVARAEPEPNEGGAAALWTPDAEMAPERRALRRALARLRDGAPGSSLIEGALSIHEVLLAQGTRPVDADAVIGRLLSADRQSAQLAQIARDLMLADLVADSLPWERIGQARAEIVLVSGPSGAGKTSSVAKIAAHAAIRAGRSVGLIAADAYRIGGQEQLETYARLLDARCERASGPDEIEAAAARLGAGAQGADLVIVDLTSLDPFVVAPTEEGMSPAAVSTLRDQLDARLYLTLPATWSAAALIDYLDEARPAGARAAIWTKLDEARRFGAIYSASRAARLPIALACDGRAVPQDAHAPKPRRIIEAILRDARSIEA